MNNTNYQDFINSLKRNSLGLASAWAKSHLTAYDIYIYSHKSFLGKRWCQINFLFRGKGWINHERITFLINKNNLALIETIYEKAQACLNSHTSVAKKDKLEKFIHQVKVIRPQVHRNYLLPKHPLPSFPDGPIQDGYGEYVIFDSSNKIGEVSEKEFNQCFLILEQERQQGVKEPSSNRYEHLKKRIKKIDENLEIAFIPRTVYELIFIRQCIIEELKFGQLTNIKALFYAQTEKGKEEVDLSNYFWQMHSYPLPKRKKKDITRPSIEQVAYRLNNCVLKHFREEQIELKSSGFTSDHFQAVTKTLLVNFKNIHQSSDSELYKRIQDNEKLYQCNISGLTTNFSIESTAGIIKPMGISDQKHEEIITNSIQLECSEAAKNSLILYRGSNFPNDDILNAEQEAYSLSYGVSLFAGAIYDGGATAFYYMRDAKCEASATVIPLKDLNQAPFYCPIEHPLIQLYSEGEWFHARSKVWDLDPDARVRGIFGASNRPVKDIPQQLKTNQSYENFKEFFNQYKSQAIILKKSKE